MNIKITPSRLHGTITAMPSKSHAHRVLIAQKLAQLTGTAQRKPLFIPEFSKDITATKRCLLQLGNLTAAISAAADIRLAATHINNSVHAGSTPDSGAAADETGAAQAGTESPAEKSDTPICSHRANDNSERPGSKPEYSNGAGEFNGTAFREECSDSSALMQAMPESAQKNMAPRCCAAPQDTNIPFLDCGESGSTLRFLLPVAMALTDKAIFAGSGKLPQRPISPLKEEMENHGCTFVMGSAPHDINNTVSSGSADAPAVICTITGRLKPGEYFLPGNISSQFITGLLFALPILDDDSTLHLTTVLESAGYVDLSLDVLRDFGIEIGIETDNNGFAVYHIKGRQKYTEPEDLRIEGDWSNAAFWLACGALGGKVTCSGLKPDSSQRDKEILSVLQNLGAIVDIAADSDGLTSVTCTALRAARDCPERTITAGSLSKDADVKSDEKSGENTVVYTTVSRSDAVCDVSENGGRINKARSIREAGVAPETGCLLKGISLDVTQIPDLVPVIAVMMSAASGHSVITGAQRLKIKESDRLATVCDFLRRLGADITCREDGLEINGMAPLAGGTVTSHNDHRIAMAAAVASCICAEPVIIKNAGAVSKSYPDFFEDFAKLGGKVRKL